MTQIGHFHSRIGYLWQHIGAIIALWLAVVLVLTFAEMPGEIQFECEFKLRNA